MADGNFAGGDGSSTNPFLIEDAFDLNAIRNSLTANYKLINDIDLDIDPYNNGEGWIPIGNYTLHKTPEFTPQFTGTLDGQGHIISNLYNKSDKTHVGIFAVVGGNASIKNVIIENTNILSVSNMDNSNRRGALAGAVVGDAVIEQCASIGGSISGRWHIAGLVGWLDDSAVIKNSYSIDMVINGHSNAGLVDKRHSSAYIINCFSNNVSENGLVLTNGDNVINSFWDIETSNTTSSAGGTGLTTEEANDSQTFIDAGWDQDIWDFNSGLYPLLSYQEVDVIFSNNMFLLKSNNKYFNINNNTLQEVDNLSNFKFKNIAMQNLSRYDMSLIRGQLENPKIIFYFNDIKNYNTKITQSPFGQLVLAKDDIPFYDVTSINNIIFNSNNYNKNNIKLIVSNDSGTTWMSYYNNRWRDINIHSISELSTKGMDNSLVESLSKDKLSELIKDSSYLRFGYYIDHKSYEAPPSVDSLNIDLQLKGDFYSLKKEEDFNYYYDDQINIQVQLLRNGNYIINY